MCFVSQKKKGKGWWWALLCCDWSRRQGALPGGDVSGLLEGGGKMQPSLLTCLYMST